MADDEQAILPFDDGSAGRIIRTVWHDGRWFFSVIDAVAVLTDSDNPRRYWSDLKKRLADEGAGELYAKIVQLKMRAIDGRMRDTDAADTETMLRIVQSIPSPKAEPFKQWLAHEGARRLDDVAARLPEDQRRLLIRGEVTEKNNSLNEAARAAGVTTSRDFAVFHDAGYKGLYGGESARAIAERKGLKKGQHILDHMGSDELAANLFRASLTDQKLRRDPVATKEDATQTHYDLGAAVRGFIIEQGGTPPEQLPTPAHSIKEIEHAEQERAKAQLQPPLFPPNEGGKRD